MPFTLSSLQNFIFKHYESLLFHNVSLKELYPPVQFILTVGFFYSF